MHTFTFRSFLLLLLSGAVALLFAGLTVQSAGGDRGPSSAPNRVGPSPVTAAQPGTWSRLADMPTARLAAGAAMIGGKLYVIGGCVVTTGEVVPIEAVEEYTPQTDTWKTKAPLPTPRSNFGIAVEGGRVFVIGGTRTDSTAGVADVEIYEPSTDRWSKAAPMPTPRSQVGAAAVQGRIYAIGGNAGHEHVFEVYDPASDRWRSLPRLDRPRRDAGVVALGGKIYVAGGVGTHPSTPVCDLEVYDPELANWSVGESLHVGRCDFALVGMDSALIAIGGWNRGPIADVEQYDAKRRTWITEEDLPVATQFACAASLNGTIYLAGGAHRLPAATNAVYKRASAHPTR